jgi:hypothetical protein
MPPPEPHPVFEEGSVDVMPPPWSRVSDDERVMPGDEGQDREALPPAQALAQQLLAALEGRPLRGAWVTLVAEPLLDAPPPDLDPAFLTLRMAFALPPIEGLEDLLAAIVSDMLRAAGGDDDDSDEARVRRELARARAASRRVARGNAYIDAAGVSLDVMRAASAMMSANVRAFPRDDDAPAELRNFVAMHPGGAWQMPADAVRDAHCVDCETGRYIGPERGVVYL